MDYNKKLNIIRQWVLDNGAREDAVLINGYVKSIIGTTHDGCVVYDYYKMIDEYCKNNNSDALEASEYIDYNIINSLDYFGESAPVIVESMAWPLSLYMSKTKTKDEAAE